MSNAKVVVRNLTKEFRVGRGSVRAVDDVSFTIDDNEFVSVVGPSGCGKSTLLTVAAGLTDPTGGSVLVDGEVIRGPGRDRGVVFQSYSLFPWLTVRANIEFALRGEELSKAERRSRSLEQLDVVGLADFADVYPAQLSGGMRQRVAIARALSYRPSVLLMDEPFGALDALNRRTMQELLTQVWENHRLTVLFITHDIDEAVFLSDRVLVMSARPGRIVEEVHVELERPRRVEMQSTKEFMELKQHLLSAVTATEPAPQAGSLA
ncbi:ABC transporter ATP-binding protein [Mycobacterium sp. 21AC1]|uniref:ABC transporter ATP-binding protein n=1 Tax=[Mycobacterium] appelbergii TaxID=2939269 RepID=UPI002938FB6E|nr:ABC transporter ATP-binding protein [Mycobacterium sp. 21AC1]MDV3127316.1 ABC transporter ATP-binding protein [Mycobacterium sp. 21AC1]